VVLPLILTSLKDTPDKRVEDSIKAAEELEGKAKSDSNIRLMDARFDNSTGGAAGLPDMKFDVEEPATITLYVVVAPKRKGDSFFEQAEMLTGFADKLVLGSVTLNVGKIQLGVSNPEQYRPELMIDIMAEMASLRKLGGPETILHVSGLEGPVEVRQIDQENVEMFINYRLTLEQRGSKDPAAHPDR